MTLAAGSHIGKYVVRRKIAEGGMAEVYLCSSVGPEGFEKEVALKRVRSMLADDPSFVEMFIAEARLASKINHANVVQIFDFDKSDDTYFLAMELIRGRSLWEVRRRARERMEPMAPLLVAQVGIEVAKGLSYAHRLTDGGKPLNIVHRDVTPHNVLISYDGAIKLTDFGIAKASNRFTAAGMLKGKFAYMSPEQARGDPVDQRTDVFALGIILWELLTGGRLFDGDSDVAVLRAVQDCTIASPKRLNPQVDPDLDAAVMKALERDVANRFQTANELERALTKYLFTHALSADDADVGAYVRRLFAGEIEAERARDREAESSADSAGGGAPPSPDDDPNGRTWKLDRERQKAEAPRKTSVSRRGPRPEAAESASESQASVEVPLESKPSAPSRRPAPASEGVDAPPTVRDAAAVSDADRPARAKTPAKRPAPARPAPVKSGGRKWALPAAIGGVVLVALAAGGWALTRTSGKAIPDDPVAQAAKPSPAKASAPEHPAATPTEVAAVPSNEAPSTQPASATVPAEQAPAPHPSAPIAATAKTEPEPEAAAPVPKYGALVLTVEPWAYVRIDGGKRRSVEGRKRFRLSPGRHHLELSQRPSGEKSVYIRIRAGHVTRLHHNPLAHGSL